MSVMRVPRSSGARKLFSVRINAIADINGKGSIKSQFGFGQPEQDTDYVTQRYHHCTSY